MFKVYSKNAHDNFEDQWNKADIEKKYNEIKTFNKEVLDTMNKYLKPGDKIIEAGCGLGQFVLYYKNKGYDILGVDFVQSAIDKLKKYDNTLNVKCEDCTKLSLADESIDFYMSFGVIEHLEEGPMPFLKEANRILKKGGLGFISVPNEECSDYFKIYDKNKSSEGLEFFEYGFTYKDYKKAIEEAGFEIVEIRYHAYFVPLCLKKIYRLGVKASFGINFLGKIIEKLHILRNDKKGAWMIGAIVKKVRNI